MAAITWQNVNAPAPMDWRGAAVVQQGMENAFDKLGAVAKRYDDTNVANWKQGAINNTNEFLNSLNAAKNPMELQALQESGKLAEMQQRFGAQADQPAIRAALDARQGLLQQQESTAREYQKGVLSDKQLPLTNAVSVLTNKGNTADAQAVLDANPELQSAAVLQKAIADRLRLTATQGQADTKATDEHDVAVQRVATDKLQGQVHQDTLLQRADEFTLKRNAAEALKRKTESDLLLKDNVYGGDGVWNPNMAETLAATLEKSARGGDDSADRSRTLTRIQELTSKGFRLPYTDPETGETALLNIPVPASLVKGLASSVNDEKSNIFSWGQGYANNFEEQLNAAMNRTQPVLNKDGSLKRNAADQAVMENVMVKAYRDYKGLVGNQVTPSSTARNVSVINGLSTGLPDLKKN